MAVANREGGLSWAESGDWAWQVVAERTRKGSRNTQRGHLSREDLLTRKPTIRPCPGLEVANPPKHSGLPGPADQGRAARNSPRPPLLVLRLSTAESDTARGRFSTSNDDSISPGITSSYPCLLLSPDRTGTLQRHARSGLHRPET